MKHEQPEPGRTPTHESTDSNPYAASPVVEWTRCDHLPWPIVGTAGALCAAAAYLPFPWRGGLFGMLPGIANRSIVTGVKGVLMGSTADILIAGAWLIFTRAWEPRFGGYNRLLADHLPPDINVATHSSPPFANWFVFGGGLTVWMGLMFAVWACLWKPELPLNRLKRIQSCGALTGVCTAAVLWTAAGMEGRLDDFRGWTSPTPFAPSPFLFLFVSMLPLSGFVMASLMHREARRAEAQAHPKRIENAAQVPTSAGPK